MAEKETKKELYFKALNLFNLDGVIDIIGGVVLFNFGFDLVNKNEATSLFTWIPIILIASIKDKITHQRLTPAQIGVDSKTLRNWTFYPAATMIFSLVVLGTLVIGDPFDIKHAPVLSSYGDTLSLVGGLVLAIICAISGILTRLNRFFIYTATAIIGGLVSYFLLPNYFLFFLTSAVMTGYGIRLMVTFTKTYPQIVKVESDES